MANYLWACWDGGGNLTPSLGIARVLTERGHNVQFFGRPQMVDRVDDAGFEATELVHSFSFIEKYSFHPLPTVFGYTSSPANGEELVGIVADQAPDVVVIDAMFSSALDVAPRFERPTAVVVHTLLDRLFSMWQANFAMQSESRLKAGFDALPGLDVLWGERDLLHVNALAALDGPPVTGWQNVRHGAPVLDNEKRAVPAELPWDTDDETPLVLLSFSTVAEQRSVEKLQRALDALETLAVHVAVTTGGIVDPGELTVPDNAHVLFFADHGPLMDLATLVVGHGGHGTTMRCLSKGLPMVCIPALAGDQAPISALVEEWGVGRALPGDVETPDIRAAVEAVLTDAAYGAEAKRRSAAFAGLNGAELAADSLETLV